MSRRGKPLDAFSNSTHSGPPASFLMPPPRVHAIVCFLELMSAALLEKYSVYLDQSDNSGLALDYTPFLLKSPRALHSSLSKVVRDEGCSSLFLGNYSLSFTSIFPPRFLCRAAEEWSGSPSWSLMLLVACISLYSSQRPRQRISNKKTRGTSIVDIHLIKKYDSFSFLL